MEGFLGTGATLPADLNLVVQLTMGLALLVGTFLARRKQFRAHKYCQSSKGVSRTLPWDFAPLCARSLPTRSSFV